MRVAVVGAGAAGLCAARHITALGSGFTCVVFEQTDHIGGTWVYSEATGQDEYGLPICSAMYKNLRTNLSKENMEFPRFPFVNSKSFLPHTEVLKYLEDYSNHYSLKQHIQFLCHVKNIVPRKQKWKLTYQNLSTKKEAVEEFDSVMLCNGHYSVPYMGDFPSTAEFQGEVKHSHSYRTPEPFIDKTVLISGGGPSGIDISYDLAAFASKVLFSHRCNFNMDAFPKNVTRVPLVQSVKSHHVIYEDGTTSGHVDLILVCTGYKYAFPFLDPECGITVKEDKFVYPLYKHVINVNHPTMAFIGLLFRSFLFPVFDLQVQFFLKSLTGEMRLPSKQDMLAEVGREILQNQEKSIPLRKYHQVSDKVKSYLEDLARLANLEDLPLVIYKIYDLTSDLRTTHLADYRNAVFEVESETDFRMSGLTLSDQELVYFRSDTLPVSGLPTTTR